MFTNLHKSKMKILVLLQVKYIGKRSKTKMDLSIKMYADEVEVWVKCYFVSVHAIDCLQSKSGLFLEA